MEKSLFKTFIEMFKKGGDIHINPKNKGKFTASAKRAGMSVQEFARHVLANKDKYSTTQVRRANFARNSKIFKHQEGGSTIPRHSDSLLNDPLTFNERFMEHREKQLTNAYMESQHHIDPNNNAMRLGITPAQYMKDQMHLKGLGMKKYDPTAESSHVKPIPESLINGNVAPDANTPPIPTTQQLTNATVEDAIRKNAREKADVKANNPYIQEAFKKKYPFSWEYQLKKRADAYVEGIVNNWKTTLDPKSGIQLTQAYGYAHPEANAYMTTNNSSPKDTVHEIHHLYDGSSLNEYDGNKIKPYDSNSTWDYEYHNPEYSLNRGEIHARIKEAFFENKLDPSHTYTVQDIQNMRKDPEFKWRDLHQISDKDLANYFNTVY